MINETRQTPDFLSLYDAFKREVAQVAPSVNVLVNLNDQAQDLCRISCEDSDCIEFTVSDHFSDIGRAHFFLINQALPFAKFYVESAMRHRTDLKALLWLDDMATEPGLVYSKSVGVDQVAVPDPYFIKSHGYAELKKQSLLSAVSWNSRKDVVFWRGVSTGYRSKAVPDWRDIPRFRMCKLLQSYPRQDFIDVGVSGIVQISNTQEIEEIKSSGLLRDRVEQGSFAEYRYSIDIDGNTNSWPGLFTKLLMGCTVLKVASPSGFTQWYYDRLHPWEHFVPVRSDFSDLSTRIDWLTDNPAEAFSIAMRGQKLARSLSYQGEMDRMVSVLSTSKYASCPMHVA